MQGMQSNPKYKKEALFLIKHFSSLSAVLDDATAYVADARERAESVHLPVLEMTVRGVLAAGALTQDQEDYLRRNAVELGVSEHTFSQLLIRVATELGVSLDGRPVPPPLVGPDGRPMDLYEVLGIEPTADAGDVEAAYDRQIAEIDGTSPDASARRARLVVAHKVLTHSEARRQYDLQTSFDATNPIERTTLISGSDPDTGPAPLAVDNSSSRLEVLGEPVRQVHLGSGRVTVTAITIRNGGVGDMGGVISVDVPWMEVDPSRLDPAAPEQVLSVQIEEDDVPSDATAATVFIQTEHGDKARVVFEITRPPPRALVMALVAALVLLAAAGMGLLLR